MVFFLTHAGEIIGTRIETVRMRRKWFLERGKKSHRQMMRRETVIRQMMRQKTVKPWDKNEWYKALVGSLSWLEDPPGSQGCGFHLLSGHIQETTMSKWNSKLMLLFLPLASSLKNQ